ncbi:MAG TPA: type II toxin-antitoxin system RelE/ParE family toxin [Burkholderiales bacterium]|nr:type II toxin-antitoxin system RelE/ParE family toxin [Burkholderiales bacterium]
MRYDVLMTQGAERDLEEIYEHIAESDSPQKADYVLTRLLEVTERLATFPERGPYPKELQALGIREYRQAYFKPYRLIYRILGKRAVIYLIADGRRDMQSALSRRLLGS